jgi:hypothetical protein
MTESKAEKLRNELSNALYFKAYGQAIILDMAREVPGVAAWLRERSERDITTAHRKWDARNGAAPAAAYVM